MYSFPKRNLIVINYNGYWFNYTEKYIYMYMKYRLSKPADIT